YVSQLLVNTPLRPHISTLFPYTTLFRSPRDGNFRISTTDRVPDRGDDRDAVSARRGVAHRRYLGLHRAPATRAPRKAAGFRLHRSEEHTSELQSLAYLVCRLLLEKKKKK